jgi:hypothetical protein
MTSPLCKIIRIEPRHVKGKGMMKSLLTLDAKGQEGTGIHKQFFTIQGSIASRNEQTLPRDVI